MGRLFFNGVEYGNLSPYHTIPLPFTIEGKQKRQELSDKKRFKKFLTMILLTLFFIYIKRLKFLILPFSIG